MYTYIHDVFVIVLESNDVAPRKTMLYFLHSHRFVIFCHPFVLLINTINMCQYQLSK